VAEATACGSSSWNARWLGEVGQAVERGALQRRAMAAHERASADGVEHRAADDQREQAQDDQRAADVAQLALEDATVVADLERVAAARKVDRSHELEVAPVLLGIGLAARVGAVAVDRGVDALIGIVCADGGLVGSRRPDHAAGIDQQRLERARPLADRVEHLGDLAHDDLPIAELAADLLERLDVGLLRPGVVRDLAVLELVGEDEVREHADDCEGRGDRHEQA
jgi:hypothetical protein